MKKLITRLSSNFGIGMSASDTEELEKHCDGNMLKLHYSIHSQYLKKNKKLNNLSLARVNAQQIISKDKNNIVNNPFNFLQNQQNMTSLKKITNDKENKNNCSKNKISPSNIFERNNHINIFADFEKKEKIFINVEEKKYKLFHTLGKILYNKRIDPITNETRHMSKQEMEAIPMPKYYFNIQDLINNLPIELSKFNEYLIENSFDHFKDIKELSKATDIYSLTDTYNKFKYKNSYVYEDKYAKLENYIILLNSMACMCVNKSQYEKTDKIEINKGKPIYENMGYLNNKQNKINKELYYKAIKKNKSVSQLGLKKFLLELKPMIMLMQITCMNQATQLSQKNGYKKNNIKINYFNDIQIDRSQFNAENEGALWLESKFENELVEDSEVATDLNNKFTSEIKIINKIENEDIENYLDEHLDDFLEEFLKNEEGKELEMFHFNEDSDTSF